MGGVPEDKCSGERSPTPAVQLAELILDEGGGALPPGRGSGALQEALLVLVLVEMTARMEGVSSSCFRILEVTEGDCPPKFCGSAFLAQGRNASVEDFVGWPGVRRWLAALRHESGSFSAGGEEVALHLCAFCSRPPALPHINAGVHSSACGEIIRQIKQPDQHDFVKSNMQIVKN